MSVFLLAAAAVIQPVQAAPAPAVRRAPPAAQRAIVAGSITDDDYPIEAVRAEVQGTTAASLDIAADGQVTGCRVVGSAGHAALDKATCDILTARFRFAPAPAATRQMAAMMWKLPDAPDLGPVPFGSSRVIVQTSYSAAGPATCRRTVEGQLPRSVVPLVCAPNTTASTAPRPYSQRLTKVHEIIAGGEPLPRGDQFPQHLHEAYRVRFEVDPSGAITACEQVGRPDEVLANRARAGDRCELLLAVSRPVFQPSASPTVRKGEFVEGAQFEGPQRESTPAP